MTKCVIQWVDRTGQITPDDNDAVGVAVNWESRRHAYNAGFDAGAPPEVKAAFPICAAHSASMPLPGWTLAPLGFDAAWLPPPEFCNICNGKGRPNPRISALRGGFCDTCHGSGLLPGKCQIEIVNQQHFDKLLLMVRGRSNDVQATFARCMQTLANLSQRSKVRITPDSDSGLYFVTAMFCGGVIYHPAQDSGVGGPAYAVRFGSEECWQIHT